MSAGYSYSFENLKVWEDSKNLSLKIYEVTKEFPDDERYGLISQMRRAAVSVSSNIAEESSRKSKADQARFYIIAFSSSIELLNQLIISCELDYISKESYLAIRLEIEKITNKLNALKNSLN